MRVSVCVVLVVAAYCLQPSHGRRLRDDMPNELSVNPAGNLAFRPMEWVKISQPLKPMVSKPVGAYVELECEVMGSPAPTVQWLKGNTPLTETENFETNMISEGGQNGLAKVRSRLIINYALPIHQGIYTCVAESGPQVAITETKLFLIKNEGYEKNLTQLFTTKILGAHHKPRITLWYQTYMDVIGNDVTLPCTTVGNPKPSLVWVDPEGQVIDSMNGRISVLPEGELRIRALKWSDMGVYNCVVKNSAGEDSIETFLYPMQDSN